MEAMEKVLEILPLSSMQIVYMLCCRRFSNRYTFVSIFMHSLQTTAPQTIISALIAAETRSGFAEVSAACRWRCCTVISPTEYVCSSSSVLTLKIKNSDEWHRKKKIYTLILGFYETNSCNGRLQKRKKLYHFGPSLAVSHALAPRLLRLQIHVYVYVPDQALRQAAANEVRQT